MAIFEFKEEEIFVNRLKTYPKYSFMIYSGTVYVNNEIQDSGNTQRHSSSNEICVPSGYISLYEWNVNRISGTNNFIYPFITKDGSLQSFATVTTSSFHNSFAYGDIITGSYPLSSSLDRQYYAAQGTAPWSTVFANRPYVVALKNTLNFYKTLSPHYAYTASTGGYSWDKSTQELNLISIPSIFYGSSIKRGSVRLKFYYTGSLIGELNDSSKNGELVQVGPTGSTGSGSVAGVVLYNEGFIILTGSWELHSTKLNYLNSTSNLSASKWVYWGAGIDGFDYDDGDDITGSHSHIEFEGVNYINTLTMFAHAPQNAVNHSNNPTHKASGTGQFYPPAGSRPRTGYYEKQTVEAKNVVETPYKDVTGSFKKTTFISEIGIYDENMNLIGVAKTAKPVKKTEEREYTFKLKIDF
mgnify:CR=1 FL=1